MWAKVTAGREVEGRSSESDFERQSLHHNLTVTMLCLHDCLHYRLGFAGEYEFVEDRQNLLWFLIKQRHALISTSWKLIKML